MPGASFTVSAPPGPRSAVDGTPGVVTSAAAVASAAVTRTFGRRAEEVPAARRFVREILGDDPACDDAELLACELVTNAVQHAADAARVTVAVLRLGAVVHVDVIDDGCIGLPHWRETDGHDEDGRGFQLVNALAERWGFLRERSGTCVWFEIAP
jgi:anti-sigma regulatory factor (Ser/Thr protein kinase)